MAAEVSSLARFQRGYGEEQHRTVGIGNEGGGVQKNSTALITRDLLGGSSKLSDSQELDLDLQVPSGWEKRLDLKTGKIYLQRCSAPSSVSIYNYKYGLTNPTFPKLQDLNFPPSPKKRSAGVVNLIEETSLDLKLVSPNLSTTNYQSVCTLDKVKSALERVEKEAPAPRKRSSSSSYSSNNSMKEYSSPSSSIKQIHEEEENDVEKITSPSPPIAAGCPGCLSYVIIMKSNPTCPRCSSVVPLPTMKKPRIDLNITI